MLLVDFHRVAPHGCEFLGDLAISLELVPADKGLVNEISQGAAVNYCIDVYVLGSRLEAHSCEKVPNWLRSVHSYLQDTHNVWRPKFFPAGLVLVCSRQKSKQSLDRHPNWLQL